MKRGGDGRDRGLLRALGTKRNEKKTVPSVEVRGKDKSKYRHVYERC